MVGDATGPLLEVKWILREKMRHEEAAALEALRVAAYEPKEGALGDVVPQLRLLAKGLGQQGLGEESKEIVLVAGALEKVMHVRRHFGRHAAHALQFCGACPIICVFLWEAPRWS